MEKIQGYRKNQVSKVGHIVIFLPRFQRGDGLEHRSYCHSSKVREGSRVIREI